ncbi:MAG: phospholipid-binding protein family [Solirubrobacterales bacterium]|nr:phospholipid-binding protein family [Solirubrobacterales bacterium]
MAAALLFGLALAGCSAGATTTSDPAANVPKIEFRSAAIDGRSLPAQYTCDGKNAPPPLEWGAVPAGTSSLVLFVTGVLPRVNGYSITVNWAVAGIDPHLHRLDPGRLPVGAVVGVATDGRRDYSVCPKAGTIEQYQFELYGLPARAAVARQFAGLPILDTLATRNSSSPTDAYGDFVVTYKRP